MCKLYIYIYLHLSEKICRIIWLFKILFVDLRTTKKKGELE